MAQRQWRSDDTSLWTHAFGDGSDGDLTISSNTTEAPIDASCSGTSGATSLSATNASFATGQLILIHQTRGTGVGGWELNKIASYTAGTITLENALTMTYTDSGASQAQVRVMKQYNNVTINSGITYTAKDWSGDIGGLIGWFAKGTTTITGSVLTSGKGFAGGIQVQANPGTAYAGEGTAGATVQQNGANGNGGGGGNQTSGAAGGGGGGNGAAGGVGIVKNGTGGAGGNAVGTASLVTFNIGGGGGGGTRDNNTSGAGAKGAGGAFIFSSVLTITGTVVNTGATGSSAANGGGGGGGAGGSVLLKCKTATLGTNLITATGGTGGVGVSLDGTTKDGGAGGVGRIHLDYSGSYTGTTSPTLDATLDATIIEPASFLMMF